MNQQIIDSNQKTDDELSLAEIINFFVHNIKVILKCGLLGGVLGIVYFFTTTNYVTTITFKNEIATNLASLNRLRQDLYIGSTKIDNEQEIYKIISNEIFWKKNLTPIFALTVDDIADIKKRQIDKIDTDASFTRLQLSVTHFDEDQSKKLLDETFSYLKNEVMTIKQRELYQSYRTAVQTEKLVIDKKQSELEKEIEYLKTRAKNLEDLKNRFPNQQNTSINQVLDPKDSASKYLPVSTQLVAVYSDLNASNEQLRRLEDSKEALDVKENIVTEFEKNYKENRLNAEGLQILFKFFSGKLADVNKANVTKLSTKIAIENFLNEINNILTIEKLNLEILDKRTEHKTKPISIVLGLFIGLIFGVFFALFLQAIKNYIIKVPKLT